MGKDRRSSGKPVIDRSFQIVGVVEGSAADHPLGNESEKPFDLIQP